MLQLIQPTNSRLPSLTLQGKYLFCGVSQEAGLTGGAEGASFAEKEGSWGASALKRHCLQLPATASHAFLQEGKVGKSEKVLFSSKEWWRVPSGVTRRFPLELKSPLI